MNRIIILILLFYMCINVKVKNDFIPHREIMVDSQSSNRISKTFVNILKNMNLSKFNFQDQFTMDWPKKKVIKNLMNGTADEIKEIPREDLLASLWILNKLQISKDKQYSVWLIVKGDDQINELKRADLENLSSLFETISEMDLINLNVTNDDVIDFLGTYKDFTNRQLGILAYSLKLEDSSNNVPHNIDFVNRIKGLLCGFGETHLEAINPEKINLINANVFQNLWGCNQKQLKALLKVAQDTKAYGPILTWNKTIVSKLGFVITAMEPRELKEIPADSFADIIPEVVQKLQEEQIKALTIEQVNCLKNETHAMYKAIMKSENNKQSGKWKNEAKIMGVFVSVLLFLVT